MRPIIVLLVGESRTLSARRVTAERVGDPGRLRPPRSQVEEKQRRSVCRFDSINTRQEENKRRCFGNDSKRRRSHD